MLEIEATSSALKKQRRQLLAEGETLIIGREPPKGLAIPWDTLISREHVELSVKKGKINVKKFDAARNEVHYQGKAASHFSMSPGDSFRVGQTVFLIQDVDSSAVLVGKSLGEYRLLKSLGVGVLGPYFGAINKKGTQQVTAKLLDESLAVGKAGDRMESQTKVLVTKRPACVSIYFDCGHADGMWFQIREYVQGTPLSKVIEAQKKLAAPKASEIIEHTARHLQELHALGLCHGNLKPNNVITRLGTVRLVDPALGCGVARRLTRADLPKEFETAVNYLAPEMIENPDAVDIRSDIYALGCIWFELLTGHPPFWQGTVPMRLASHAKQSPPRTELDQCGLDPAITALIMKSLAKSPRDRFQTPEELLSQLMSPEMKGARISCSGCGKQYRIKGGMAGKRVKCTSCGAVIAIPHELTV